MEASTDPGCFFEQRRVPIVGVKHYHGRITIGVVIHIFLGREVAALVRVRVILRAVFTLGAC